MRESRGVKLVIWHEDRGKGGEEADGWVLRYSLEFYPFLVTLTWCHPLIGLIPGWRLVGRSRYVRELVRGSGSEERGGVLAGALSGFALQIRRGHPSRVVQGAAQRWKCTILKSSTRMIYSSSLAPFLFRLRSLTRGARSLYLVKTMLEGFFISL